MAIICPICGAENADSADFCTLCLGAMGFNSGEYTNPEASDEGLLDHYPSSFDPGAPGADELAPPDGERPDASPVEIGEYGIRSGNEFDVEAGVPDPRFKAPPVPEWEQQPSTGAGAPYESAYQEPAHQAPGEAWQQGYSGAYQAPAAGYRPFDWGRAFMTCAGFGAIAALMSIGLELFLSFLGYSIAVSSSMTIGLILVLLSLLIPVAFASFACGYKLERYGWAVGLISVGMWAFIFRPLYYAILSWMLTDSFTFTALFNRYSLAFIFGLFLPLGALIGWLGEKRATTGLYF